jgi:hypothetical protein
VWLIYLVFGQARIANGQMAEKYLDILRAVDVSSKAANLQSNNRNEFANPALFEWDTFEQACAQQPGSTLQWHLLIWLNY